MKRQMLQRLLLSIVLGIWLLPSPAWAALARTTYALSESGVPHGTGSFTTAAFTPPDNSIVVVIITAMEQVPSADPSASQTISDSVGLTWTSQLAIGNAAGGVGLRMWTAPVTTGASMTITADCGASDIQQYTVHRYAYTGYNIGSPTGATASNGDAGADGALTITLSASPATDSEVIGVLSQEMAGSGAGYAVTVGTGWTEIYEATVDTDFVHAQSQVRTGSTSTSVTWDDIAAGGINASHTVAAALEIKAAAVGGGAAPSSLGLLGVGR